MRTPTALVLAIFATLAAACGGESNPGTSVEVNLVYDETLGLDTADVTVVDRTESARIAHRLFLLVPDELAATDMPIEVWGRKAGKRAAYGVATAVPVLGKTNTATVTLSSCSPGCQGAMLTTCTGPMLACPLGCSEDDDAHCILPRPSNQVDPALADRLRGTTTIAADATFDTDTGAITGGLVRAPGVGDGSDDGVGYQQQAPTIEGPPLGIFVFHNLTVNRGVTVQFTGTRAVVLLVGDAARIGGTLDLAAGHAVRSTPGPGGSPGGTLTTVAQGCGAGGQGNKGTVDAGNAVEDSGGGGAGGGEVGGRGGDARSTSGTSTPGGLPGKRCLTAELQAMKLQGGSGGGAGSPGMSVDAARGGGGGGAIQITALGSLEVTGTIQAGGAGGEGGLTGSADMTDAGAGGGGGGGGAILIEAPVVTIGSGAVLAANGGGGGGGGSTAEAGTAGENGRPSATPALGGPCAAVLGVGSGGNGGTAATAATPGSAGTSNANGGGGAVGTITLRGKDRLIAGTISPDPLEQNIDPL